MASALLASRNEPYWGDPKVYMRKNPNLNPKFFPNPNPNFDHQRADGHASVPRDQLRSMEFDEPSASAAAAAAAASDSSSFNRKPAADLGQRSGFGDHVTFHIASYSKKELRELKRRLMSELDQVRSVSSRIESRELQPSFRSAGYTTSAAYAGGREVSAAAALPKILGSEAQAPRPTPNANSQAPYDPDITRQRPLGAAAAPELKKLHTAMMKKCSQMLTKLMKHKGAIWFNTPVDVVGMGLHDYHQIIKSPMDLGTVKSKLSKGFYHSPLEFASDVRLTFKNALVYNPEGHDVHRLADQLLKQFESMFAPAIAKHEKQRSAILSAEEDRRQSASSSGRVGSTTKPEPRISLPHHVQTPVQSKAAAAAAPSHLVQPQLQQQPLPQQDRQTMRAVEQQPWNPEANDPNSKRPMSLEEKHRLGSCIQNLPDEKMAEVLQIVSRRNETLQNGDEVEIDFEVMDNETLWELDRFVGSWNKMSKSKKRQEIMANGHSSYQDPSSVAAAPPPAPPPPEVYSKSSVPAAETPEALAAKKSKKGDPVDEEVDIGDDMPAIHYPSVEIEKESSSSSSGSDSSSSSSDSDSGSSSGSDSDDDDEARSLAVGSKPSPRS